ncbi:MAG: RecQ family ATP-dependent DNA helicase [Candidatus Delongbacteria bacterium]
MSLEARELLHRHFGHPSFRGQQEAVVDHVLAGGNALVVMPTGQGKSLCYQLPALARPGLTVVVSPLIALMKDQTDALRARGLDAVTLNSSQSGAERGRILSALAQGRHRLLHVSPERFRKPAFRQALAARPVEFLAVDEAHCISEWGHDFRPDYTRLAEFRQLLKDPVTLALTATATPRVQEDIVRQLGLRPAEIRLFHDGVERPNLRLAVQDVHGVKEKAEWLIRLLRETEGSAIVYFALIRSLEELSPLLEKAGLPHLVYHGQLPRQRRRAVQEAFMGDPQARVLATNAFGLGVDKAQIRLIAHAEVPGSLEAYAQEIGRAGRDGRPADCVLLYDQQDLLIQMQFVDWANPAPGFLERLLTLLRDRPGEVQAGGLDFLREELVFKSRFDFRLETALSLLERHGVLEGDLERGAVQVLRERLPEPLADEERAAAKKRGDLTRLHDLVRYVGAAECRHRFLHRFFGAEPGAPCGDCDVCRSNGPFVLHEPQLDC